MDRVYRIAKWSETFETADSRRHKSLAWVSLPLGSSNGYNDLVETFGDEAPAVYGAWCALLRVAAQAPARGTLANSKGVGYSISRIAAETRFPATVFEKLFAWASSESVGWLEFGQQPATDQSPTSQEPADERATEPNRTEQDPTQPNTTDRTNGAAVGRPVGRELAELPADPILLGAHRWRESQGTRERIARVVSGDPAVTPQKLREADRELCIRAATVAHYGEMPPDWLENVLKGIQARKTPLENRWAFFRAALIKSAGRVGKNYHELEARVVIPSSRSASEQTCTSASSGGV